ncbi:spore germination protein [Brevibacillus dissolubilis]|uniref:spore germination protein n=1 Tax=Brevibacillus dissolubilis TaxID=1844116 RepID=UPI001116BFB7|nr:spore germination protein [Brevibacillus dissolubilis]
MNDRKPSIHLEDLNVFREEVKQRLGNTPDLIFRHVKNYLVVYISGLADQERIEREIVTPISHSNRLSNEVVKSPNLRETNEIEILVQALLAGIVVVARKGGSRVILANLAAAPHRGISEPQTEAVIRGPREGFTEMLELNIALIRRRLHTDKLRMKYWKVGQFSHTEVRLLYLEGVAQESVVEEMSRRIEEIRIDAVLESNYIEELVRDHPLNIFPTMQFTERPDVVVGNLLEGKIAVLVDNSPFALLAPFQFWAAFQASEDYYINFNSATFIRLIRAIFIFIALLFPSFYVAITTFHQEMLPTNLLLSVAAARETTPFPAIIEALMMEVTFEALREAGVRLPRPVGQAVSIVGALVIGQAAVQAGIVSAPMVIVVSVTGIASFTIPRYNMSFSFRILRFILIILAGTLGLFGIVFGLMMIAINLTGMRTLGVPYLAPVAPMTPSGLKDLLIRAPFWLMNRRPPQSVKENEIRVPINQGVTQSVFDFQNLPLANQSLKSDSGTGKSSSGAGSDLSGQGQGGSV